MNQHMPSSPRVSLGLPLYNGGHFLSASLDSLLGQTFEDFELIISDNGSTDDSRRICEDYAARDRRIRFYSEPENRGAVWNFNRVFQLARGEYFKWSAHDDICLPSFVERCVAVLDEHDEAVVSFPRTALIDASGRLLEDAKGTHADEGGLQETRPDRRLRELLIRRVWVHEIYGLMRVSALRRTRLLPRYVGAEKVLMAEMALQGTFHQIPEVLFHCRWHAQQASWIASASEEQRWRDPRSAHLVHIPRHLACSAGQLDALLRADLTLAERVRCLSAVARWMLQIRKWRRLVTHFLRGLGSGGGGAAAQGPGRAEQSENSAPESSVTASHPDVQPARFLAERSP